MGAFFLASVIGLATSTPLFQKEWACVQSISGKGPVRYVAFTPDAKKLVWWNGRTVTVYDVGARKTLHQMEAPSEAVDDSVRLSSDGRLIVAGVDHRETVLLKVWRVDSGRLLSERKIDAKNWLGRLDVSPDATTVCIATVTDVHLVDLALGKSKKTFGGIANDCRFSPDGRMFAIAEMFLDPNPFIRQPTVTVWELGTGKRVKSIEDSVYGLAFSPRNKFVALRTARNGIRIFQVDGWKEHKRIMLRDRANVVAFSPDESMVAAGTHRGEVLVWNVATGKLITKLKAHKGRNRLFLSAGVLSLAFSRDGKLLATGGEDKRVRIWTLP
ncbi:MAG: hypothetical protein KatS3mg105_0616 [Gemmatales bacterium]|nr:MAG: hypothetical protein KatS3mg105_0616 [Gemmatales bacterium]